MAIDPSKISEAQRLLNRARVIAEASASQPGESSHQHPSSRPLWTGGPRIDQSSRRSTLKELHDLFVAAIRADDDEAMEGAIEKATAELRAITHRGEGKAPESPAQRRQRILTQYEGRHYADVAEIEGMDKTSIWKMRINDGRSGVWGGKLKTAVEQGI